MTTEELQSAFPPGIARPNLWPPGIYSEYAALRESAMVAESLADRIWCGYWWNDTPPTGTHEEATVFQVTDILLRLSGLLMIDAARLAT